MIYIILPIYKNKGEQSNPQNFRPITFLSCFGKLFTSVLNARLSKFIEQDHILEENPAGFRKGYLTTEHVFVLHSLIEIIINSNKKLFCCSIDFSQAFDSVWRVGLWQKLIKMTFMGKMFRIIYTMYQKIKSCVSLNKEQSLFFTNDMGLRQGENFSPVLFSLYLNDLESYLLSHSCKGIDIEANTADIYFYIRLLVLI